jgi:trehalose-phosphatase
MSRRVRSTPQLPSALGNPELGERLGGRPLAVFCDYDGTLTPIVAHPERATLAEETRVVLERLARLCPVAVISGRDLEDVRAMIAIEGVWYAGSHGLEIAAPDGTRHHVDGAGPLVDPLGFAADLLEAELVDVPGAWVERKRFAVATHFRQVEDDRVPDVEAAVDRALVRHPGLRRTDGKRVFELRPGIAWDKGRALRWLLAEVGSRGGPVVPVYFGDDLTDEDAFMALDADGIGIVVASEPARPSAADYRVTDVDDVRTLLTEIAARLEGTPS